MKGSNLLSTANLLLFIIINQNNLLVNMEQRFDQISNLKEEEESFSPTHSSNDLRNSVAAFDFTDVVNKRNVL